MSKLINKLFIGGDWNVQIRSSNRIIDVKPKKNYWYADPFLVKNGDITYLFVEAFDKKKELGALGYLSSSDNYKNLTIIKESNCHYSFPNVFLYKNRYYMIPESSEDNNIFLYLFDKFPFSIKAVKKISTGDFVDTALVQIINDVGYFLTYDVDNLKLYLLMINFNSLNSELMFLLDDVEKQYRPAGNAFFEDDMLLMPFQNSKLKYGESIVVRELLFNDGKIRLGEQRKELKPIDFNLEKAKRIHTFNKIDEEQFVIDYMNESFMLLKSFRMLRRILRRKLHKKVASNG